MPRLLVDKRPVQERERLRPGCGNDSLFATAGGIGPVEQLDFGNAQAALGEDVDAAPGLLAVVRLTPALTRLRLPFEHGAWQSRIEAGAGHSGVQLAAHGQDRIADHFGV